MRPNYAIARFNLAEAIADANPKRAITEYETYLALTEGNPRRGRSFSPRTITRESPQTPIAGNHHAGESVRTGKDTGKWDEHSRGDFSASSWLVLHSMHRVVTGRAFNHFMGNVTLTPLANPTGLGTNRPLLHRIF